MKKIMAVLVICLCVALATGLASGNAAAQGNSANAVAGKAGGGGGSTGGKVDPTAATIQFWDRDSDQIKSDGLGPYAGQVQQNYPAQEILVNLVKRSTRRLWYDYTNRVSTECHEANGPTGFLEDAGYFAIKNAGDIPVGATAARRGIFYTSAFQWNFGNRVLSNNPGVNCSFEVVVTRVNQTTWYVTTDAVPGQTLLNFDGQEVLVGSQAQLQTSAGYFVGNYHMSFGMTVVCPGCR